MKVDLQDLIMAVRKAAANNPDFEYVKVGGSSCVYFAQDRQPSCIVGHGLHQLGITAEMLEPDWNAVCATSLLHKFAEQGEPSNDVQLRNWLSKVQNLQDNGTPWAKAVAEADKSFGYV